MRTTTTSRTSTSRRWRGVTATALAGVVLGAVGTPAAAAADDRDSEIVGAPRSVERLVERLRGLGAIGIDVEGRDGAETWSTTSGRSRLAPSRPARTGASFRAGSVSKQLVSVLALQLVDDGTWTLDTTLGDVAPDLWPGREDVTVRQLLSHTSALPEFLLPLIRDAVTTDAFRAALRPRRTDAELVALARQEPVTAQPGQFSYSNTNYVVLGQLLRRETGRSVQQLARARIFGPADMDESYFAEGRVLPGPRLREYAVFPGERVDLRGFSPTMFSSAGSLVSTTSDLNDFHRALESGDLLPRRLVRTMQREVAPGSGYGLGSYRLPEPCGATVVNGHDGASFGTFTFSFAAGPRRAVTVAMTGRHYDPDRFTAQLETLLEIVDASFTAMCGRGADRPDLADLPRPVAVPVSPALQG